MQEKKSGSAKFLGHRLRQWRQSVPLKSYELAKLISISQGSLSDIENNKSLPSADTISKIYLNTNINIIWLLTGKGAMKKGDLPGEGRDARPAVGQWHGRIHPGRARARGELVPPAQPELLARGDRSGRPIPKSAFGS